MKYLNPDTGEVWDSDTGQITKATQQQMAYAPQQQEGSYAMETLKNVPGSAWGLLSDIGQAVINPIETGKGLYDVARGGLSMAMGWDDPAEAAARGVGQYYSGRYGGGEEIAESFKQDPLGVMTDVAGLVTGAGAAARAPSVAKAGAALDPVSLATNLTATTAKSVDPRKLYQSAAKFPVTTKRSQKDINRMTDTALREGITPTEDGLLQLNETVTDLNTQIQTAIDAAGSQSIPKDALFRNLKDVRNDLRKGISAPRDLKEVDRIVGDYNEFLEQSGKASFNARDLQDLKTRLYTEIDFDRANQLSSPAKEQTYKAIARAARESIEDLTGNDANVKALNRREGDLLDLKYPLEQAASRIERRDLIGIGAPIKVMTGQTAGGPGGGLLGLASGIIDAPKPKAGISMLMYDAGQKSIRELLSTPRFRQGLRLGLLEASQIGLEERERQEAER